MLSWSGCGPSSAPCAPSSGDGCTSSATWYRTQELPAEHPTASITYFGPAAANLALAYRLTGQPHYLDEAWRWISTCLDYPHWGKAKLPDHDLDAGWLLHGLSLAYSWLGDDLDADARGRLAEKLELQGQRLFDFAVATEGSWWSSSYWQNHNWICYAGLATAGYALGRSDWTERARANFDVVLSQLAADGSDAEGVVYWRYGVPWLAVYLDLVERTEGIKLWDDCSFLANTMTWRLHQSMPGFEENFDHGDCHDRRSGHSVALYYKLAAAYRDGRAQWLADDVAERSFWREAYASGVKPGVMPEAFYELLWYDPSIEPTGLGQEPVTGYFPDLGQVTTRTSWADPAATAVSFKSAPGGGNTAWDAAERDRNERGWETLDAGHHHPDAGAFVLASHGSYLAVDDGYANHKRAEHHNLVTVDGHGWMGDGGVPRLPGTAVCRSAAPGRRPGRSRVRARDREDGGHVRPGARRPTAGSHAGGHPVGSGRDRRPRPGGSSSSLELAAALGLAFDRCRRRGRGLAVRTRPAVGDPGGRDAGIPRASGHRGRGQPDRLHTQPVDHHLAADHLLGDRSGRRGELLDRSGTDLCARSRTATGLPGRVRCTPRIRARPARRG